VIVTDTVKAAASSRNEVPREAVASGLNAINPETVAVTPITLIERHGLQHLI